MNLKKPLAILAAALCCPVVAFSPAGKGITANAQGDPGWNWWEQWGWGNPWENPNPQEDPNQNQKAIKKGDINDDGSIDVFDLIIAKTAAVSAFTGKAFDDDAMLKAADVNEDGEFNVADLVQINEYITGKRTQFEKAEQNNNNNNNNNNNENNNNENNNNNNDSGYMAKVRSSMTQNVPGDMTSKQAGVNYGTVEKKSYFSTDANRMKSVNVILPANYNSSKQYPVMYVLHGIFGNEDSMLDGSMAVQALATNLAAKGEAEEMIIVLPSMYTSKTKENCGGFTAEETAGYDAFLYDIANSLMPFIEQNYSVKTGRENTAITGFSMGGREALYIGLMRSDLFGYIGAACPAPGITPTTDKFMTHPGCLQESELKFKAGNPLPEILMISGARVDGTVGDYPERYHNNLTQNSVDHIWQVVDNGDHGGNTVRPHLYNFIKAVFKNS